MAWCLMSKHADELKKSILSGEINPDKLSEMKPQERHEFFSKIFGEENAGQMNRLLESKLLLKNKQRGMISWAEKLLKVKPEVKRDLISRIERMDERIMDPANEEAFLQDLASYKIGTKVSYEQVKKINEFSKKLSAKRDWKSESDRVSYGRSLIEMNEYLDSINPQKASIVTNIANIPRAGMTMLDLSAPLQQGWGMMSRPEYYKAFKDMFKFAVSEESYQNAMAEIITRPNYHLMKSGNLRITRLTDKLSQREEALISNLLDKVPVVRGSIRAYTGFLNKLRADTFDTLIKQAEASGEQIYPGSKSVRDIASTVNNFTGSGNIGRDDKYANVVPFLNALFFSPRKLSAMINMFNPIKLFTLSPTARKAHVRQLLGSIGMTSTFLALASLHPDVSVELDPRSSTFARLNLGDTKIDLTGGAATYISFLARMALGEKKTMKGKIQDLSSGKYGQKTRLDVAEDFARNKAAPIASFIVDWADKETTYGEKFDAVEGIKDRLFPMLISDTIDVYKSDPELLMFTLPLNLFGAGSTTYSEKDYRKRNIEKALEKVRNRK